MNKRCFMVGVVSLVSAFSLVADHHKASVDGVWYSVGTTPNGEESKSTLTITKKDGKLAATSVNDQGRTREFDRVTFEGQTLKGEIDFERDGQTGVLGVKATLDKKGILKGNWYLNDANGTELFGGDWGGHRALDKVIAGTWNVVAETDNGDNEHQLIVSKSGASFSGSVEGDGGSLELDKVTVKKNKLTVEFPFGDGSITVEAAQTGAKKMTGKWIYFDSTDVELGSGNWTAKK